MRKERESKTETKRKAIEGQTEARVCPNGCASLLMKQRCKKGLIRKKSKRMKRRGRSRRGDRRTKRYHFEVCLFGLMKRSSPIAFEWIKESDRRDGLERR
jgi:hypothetical protein